MAVDDTGAEVVRGHARGRRRARAVRATWVVVGTCVALTLAACGQGGGAEVDKSRSPSVASPTPGGTDGAQGSAGPPLPLLIRTRIDGFEGEVVSGSTIGDASFCPGGLVHHEHGSLEVGHPAVNVFDCPDGQLQIGFGPGPEQMDRAVQTSDWEVLEGSGRYADASGTGRMRVRFDRAGGSRGREVFTGEIAIRRR